MSSNFELFPASRAQRDVATDAPPGFRYRGDLIPPEEEATLVGQIARLELRPFEFHGHLGLRRVRAFGYRYDYTRARLASAEAIPGFLLPLRRQIGFFAGQDPQAFQQVLATEYAPGAPIGWHRDKAAFDVVVGVSLLASCVLRLRRRRADGKWDRWSTTLEPRSAYLLSGDSRTEWEHSIAPLATLRYSLTFRTLSRESTHG